MSIRKFLITFSVMILVVLSSIYGSKLQTITYATGLNANFITRSGDKLMDGSNQFRWISVNCLKALGPMGLNYNFGDSSNTLPTDQELNDLVTTVQQMGGKVMRTYVISAGTDPLDHVQINSSNTVTLNETSMKRIDKLIQLCVQQGIRLCIPLCNQYDWCGGISAYEANNGGDMYTIGSVADQRLKNMISQLVNRTNTYTGVKYKDDPAILCWATGNELAAPDAWVSDLAAYIKSVDPNHLVMDGKEKYSQIYPTYGLLNDPNVDIVGTSLYYTDGTAANTVSELRAVTKGYKPLVITEVSMDLSPTDLSATLDEVVNDGTTAAMYWALEGHSRNGGFYFNTNQDLHWPGFASVSSYLPDISVEQQKVDTIANHAYQISGLSRPALPVPAAPSLDPITDVGHITWFGSAGAQSYEIDRATSSSGPWTTLQSNALDCLIDCHSLYSDTTAVAGQSYYYRVEAKNTSGISASSNVVGPVSVTSDWLVDDMFDFSRMYSHDSNMSISSSYQSGVSLGEDTAALVRNNISHGSVVYKINGNITSFNVYEYMDQTTYAANTFYVSPDGVNYTQITPTVTTWSGPDGGYRDTITSNVAAGYQYLKITFNETTTMSWPAIGRVEIAYAPSTPGTNEVLNPEFDNGTTNWQFWNTAPAAGSISAVTGKGMSGTNAGKATITNGGSYDYSAQVVQSGISLVSGKTYTISFMAKADASRALRVNLWQDGGSYVTYWSASQSLTTSNQTFTYQFTATSTDPAACLIFNVGASTTSVYIDDVSVTANS